MSTNPGQFTLTEDTRQQLGEILAAYAKILNPTDPESAAALAAIEEFNASFAHPMQDVGNTNVALLILAAISHIKRIEESCDAESRHRTEAVASLQEKGDLSGL